MGMDGVGLGFGLNAAMQGIMRNVVPQITPEGRMRLKREEQLGKLADIQMAKMEAQQSAEQEIAGLYKTLAADPAYQPETQNVDMDTGETVKVKNPNQKNLGVELESKLPDIYRKHGLIKEAAAYEKANFNKSLQLAQLGTSLGKVKNPVYRKAGIGIIGQGIKLIAGQLGIDQKQIETYLTKANDPNNEEPTSSYMKGISTLLGAFKENKDPILLQQGFLQLTEQFKYDIDENDSKMAENAVKNVVANDQKMELLNTRIEAIRDNIMLRAGLKGGGGGGGDSGVQVRHDERMYYKTKEKFDGEVAKLEKANDDYKKLKGEDMPLNDWNRRMKDIKSRYYPQLDRAAKKAGIDEDWSLGGTAAPAPTGTSTKKAKGGKPPLSAFDK